MASKRVSRCLHSITEALGKPITLAIACTIVIAWFVVATTQQFSAKIQLPINTFTTIVTFLIVFVIQHTQNTHEDALQRKLDEILRALPDADDRYRAIERPDVDAPDAG